MTTTTPLALLAGFAALALSLAAHADDDRGLASRTAMSAAQEVQDPPVESGARATAVIRFSRDFSAAWVRIRFSGLQGAFTRLHIHCNVAGANGPVAIGLIDTVAPALDNSDVITLSGHRIFGKLTNAQFPDGESCEGVIGRPVNNIVSLAAAADAGLLYWNLHTDAYPGGELRGQLRPVAHGDSD
ncbi:MAG: CHRD domain-containing protein [Woeseiaceae bacterium]|nr:CHRD domain-containing protein [Woeseiaceae bacterium]